jgi:glycosyltransferase involved in cell wall biosynthesis
MDPNSSPAFPWIPVDYHKRLVSVIVPTYNRAGYLPMALDSVWAQSYRPIELIVCDDGSTDETNKIVEAWAKKHQSQGDFELSYIYQENGGVCSARNHAMRHSRGEYIQFLDSDDMLYPDMVSSIVSAFDATDREFVLVGYDKICGDCGQKIYSFTPHSESDAIKTYMTGNLSGNSISVCRRRDLIQKVGPWNETLINDADGNYLVRTILQSRQMATIPEQLFAYLVRTGDRLSDNKGTRASWLCYLERETLFCDHLEDYPDLSPAIRGAYVGRLYEWAARISRSGFSDISQAFLVLASDIDSADLDRKGKILRLAASGKGLIYGQVDKMRQIRLNLLRRSRKSRHGPPTCVTCGQ